MTFAEVIIQIHVSLIQSGAMAVGYQPKPTPYFPTCPDPRRHKETKRADCTPSPDFGECYVALANFFIIHNEGGVISTKGSASTKRGGGISIRMCVCVMVLYIRS